MHATLDELLEHSQHGLLWVGQDGTIRHINSQGGQRTGLALGRKLFDPDLKRALVEVITSRTPKVVKAIGAAPRPGAAPAELNCRVLPGLAKDDAFVVVQAEGADSGGVAFDNLMQVIRTDLRDPLRQAQQALAGALRTGVANDMKVAGEHVDSLIKLVEKLVDLAAVWRSDALMSADRIELWPLLQQCWAEVEPLAQQRSVTARLQVEGELKTLPSCMAVSNGSSACSRSAWRWRCVAYLPAAPSRSSIGKWAPAPSSCCATSAFSRKRKSKVWP
ncbi:hypothetical protein [Ideonella paludis]|uniref:hypothetical protein n=1 Tax=Ideonella paludis TaxID=1233411 RepID=UPI00362BC31E